MALRYDDRDARVQYSGTWAQTGVEEEYMQTTSSTASIGATVRVTFTGQGISVYGAISRTGEGYGNAPKATFVIDDTVRTPWEGQQNDRIQRGIQLHSIGGLDYGEHVLTIINDSDQGRLWLDYFEITGTDDPGSGEQSSTTPPSQSPTPIVQPASPIQSSSPSSSSQSDAQATRESIPSASAPSSGSSLLPGASSGASLESHALILPSGTKSISPSGTPTSVAAFPGYGRTGPPVGAVIGGVVGGLAAICLLVIAFFVFKRQRRRRHDNLGAPLNGSYTHSIIAYPSPDHIQAQTLTAYAKSDMHDYRSSPVTTASGSLNHPFSTEMSSSRPISLGAMPNDDIPGPPPYRSAAVDQTAFNLH
ncbi:hypothetical protein BKA70DRAFT_1525010 [Coprinopsis sp. MPI-PUGE-AT-0042]|nr:hypothetical protein BKA70DRAFT_1525010 [Coprinopsis sp. MPI-PUGE-AT-0042]